jgi:hypothetical protein
MPSLVLAGPGFYWLGWLRGWEQRWLEVDAVYLHVKLSQDDAAVEASYPIGTFAQIRTYTRGQFGTTFSSPWGRFYILFGALEEQIRWMRAFNGELAPALHSCALCYAPCEYQPAAPWGVLRCALCTASLLAPSPVCCGALLRCAVSGCLLCLPPSGLL